MPVGNIPTLSEILAPVGGVIWNFFSQWWWLIGPPALFFMFLDVWKLYIQIRYWKSLQWVMLEIKIPKEIMKTPKAMEQVFAGLHAMLDPPNFSERWWIGRFQEWASFEICGTREGMRFFIRAPKKFKNLIEASIYSQYPQAEILEAEDYTAKVPMRLPNKEYDFWGTTMKFAKPDPYPIRLYSEFEEAQEEKRIDPMSMLSEAMSHMQEGEQLWVQLLIKPLEASEWVPEGEKIVAKLIGKKEAPGPYTLSQQITDFIVNLIRAPVEPPTWREKTEEKEVPESLMLYLSPGTRFVVESIEKKISKLGFAVSLKWIYLARRDIFRERRALNVGMALTHWRQFNAQNMNEFRVDKSTMTKTKYLFKGRRLLLRQRMLLFLYRMRLWYRKPMVLNTEELATIFHFPTALVEAPKVIRIEAKKGGPPPTLPIGE